MTDNKKKLPLLKWRGTLGEASRSQRLMMLASQLLIVASLVFSQAGFVGIALPDNNSTYLITVLAPMALVAMVLGLIPSTLFGIFCGLTLALHAAVQPLDYIELVAVTPQSAAIIFGITGLLLGLLFALALRRNPTGWRRIARIVLICLAVSTVFSIVFLIVSTTNIIIDYGLVLEEELGGNVTESNIDGAFVISRMLSYGNPELQILVDATLMIAVCWMSERLLKRLGIESDARPLHTTFNAWLFLAVLLGYLVVTAFGFVSITGRELHLAADDMREEIEYLDIQRKTQEQRGILYTQSTMNSTDVPENVREIFQRYFSAASLLDGYETAIDGVVIVASGSTTEAEIVCSTDQKVVLGNTLEQELEVDTVEAIKKSLETGRLRDVVLDYLSSEAGESFRVARLGYLLAVRSEPAYDTQNTDYVDDSSGYIYVIIRPAEMVFGDRGTVVRWMAQTTFVLMALVYGLVSNLLNRVVVAPISRMGEELDAICDGKLDTVVDARGSAEFVGLSTGINATVDRLKELIAEAKKRIEQELATARAIQSSALPSRFPPFPEIDTFDLYASMDPAREVGGDFYDFFLTDENTVAFLVADVAGKGIPGALFMMASKAELDNFLMTGISVADAVKRSNERLCEGNDADMFVTAWVAKLDYHTGVVTYVNAGHNPPLLRHEGKWVWLREKSGLFMGSFELAKYKSFELTLQPGDELLVYSDGVNEAFSVDGVEYGNDQLEAFVNAHSDLGPQELVEALRADVARWAEGAEQSDDITILALEYHPNGWSAEL